MRKPGTKKNVSAKTGKRDLSFFHELREIDINSRIMKIEEPVRLEFLRWLFDAVTEMCLTCDSLLLVLRDWPRPKDLSTDQLKRARRARG